MFYTIFNTITSFCDGLRKKREKEGKTDHTQKDKLNHYILLRAQMI